MRIRNAPKVHNAYFFHNETHNEAPGVLVRVLHMSCRGAASFLAARVLQAKLSEEATAMAVLEEIDRRGSELLVVVVDCRTTTTSRGSELVQAVHADTVVMAAPTPASTATHTHTDLKEGLKPHSVPQPPA